MAMRSPLSPVIGNVFIESSEKAALERTDWRPPIALRYVDGHSQYGHIANPILNDPNDLEPTTKFTIVQETAQTPLFIEVLVGRNKNFIKTSVQI
jgi:hypothetical protein